jgi:hypothetical protein
MADAIVIAVVVLFIVGVITINVLKGKRGFAVVGLIVHIVWYVGAIRLAKPDSWWARRYYGPEKLERSRMRFVGRESNPLLSSVGLTEN